MRKRYQFRFLLFFCMTITLLLGGAGCSGSGSGSGTSTDNGSGTGTDNGSGTGTDNGSGTGSDNGSFSNTPFVWDNATPESQGMSTARLNAMWSDIEARETVAFLVMRNDKVVYEKYVGVDFDRYAKHYTASVAKSVVGSMSLMVAMQDGRISAGDLVSDYVPQARRIP